ncbi:hypothetical protein V2I01_18855 [Micromonospora sp. BRA006-A]|nr:hypothetical protein [Micromonospora sp. BRA006-A]
MSGWYRDQGGKDYRTDCSGYVSMAWHLSASAWTGNLGKVATQISKTSLLPGDALNSPAEHVILFKRWINQSTGTFEYYSFGSTPVKIATETLTGGSDGLIDSHPASSYVALRYRNVIGSGGTPVRDPWIADVTGDGFTIWSPPSPTAACGCSPTTTPATVPCPTATSARSAPAGATTSASSTPTPTATVSPICSV